MNLPHIYPAIIREYNRPTRQCRIEIPGMTDGAEVFPLAECLQPLGDRTEDNEIRLKVGDRVYVQFLNGDPRHPLIVGFRAKNASNNIGRRHLEQDNIHTISDETQLHEAGTSYTTTAGTSQSHTAETTFLIEAGTEIKLKVGGTTLTLTAGAIAAIATAISAQGAVTIDGAVAQTNGDITSDGTSVQNHTHTAQGATAVTTPPN